jgi:hypothetical protein
MNPPFPHSSPTQILPSPIFCVLMASCFPDENTFMPEAPKLANAMRAAGIQ